MTSGKYLVDYGIKHVTWDVRGMNIFKALLSYIPIINLFFARKLRIDICALTTTGCPICGTMRHVYVPKDATILNFKGSLGRDIMCRGAYQLLITVDTMDGIRLSSRTISVPQSEMAKWNKYTTSIFPQPKGGSENV